jgi:hypothetical protein
MLQSRWSGRLVGPLHLIAACLSLGACDHTASALSMPTPPNANTVRLETPDRNFKLTSEERASIRPDFDVDALERLLAAVAAPVRPMILREFQIPPRGAQSGALVRMGDPVLQPLLDEVWATFWEKHTDMLDTETKAYPGMELARQRRNARAQGKAAPPAQPPHP